MGGIDEAEASEGIALLDFPKRFHEGKTADELIDGFRRYPHLEKPAILEAEVPKFKIQSGYGVGSDLFHIASFTALIEAVHRMPLVDCPSNVFRNRGGNNDAFRVIKIDGIDLKIFGKFCQILLHKAPMDEKSLSGNFNLFIQKSDERIPGRDVLGHTIGIGFCGIHRAFHFLLERIPLYTAQHEISQKQEDPREHQ